MEGSAFEDDRFCKKCGLDVPEQDDFENHMEVHVLEKRREAEERRAAFTSALEKVT